MYAQRRLVIKVEYGFRSGPLVLPCLTPSVPRGLSSHLLHPRRQHCIETAVDIETPSCRRPPGKASCLHWT